MSKQRRAKQAGSVEEFGEGHRSNRWEQKRERFAHQRSGTAGASRPLRRSTYLTVGGALLVVVFVMLMTFRGSADSTASAAPLQQVAATSAVTENGRVSISTQEVVTKRLVAWDYRSGGTTVPLLAYVTPSGSVKIATRLCEPCNSTSFRVEGNQLVCNACGSRWDLETSRGISGGCQSYPPQVLPSTVDGGRISVDETVVASWKPRV